MTSKQLYCRMGMTFILLSGMIHLYIAPLEYQEASYQGIVFLLFAVGSVISAIGINRGELVVGWLLGGILSLGAVLGYLVSRTVGLPFSGIEDWGPSLANLSIFVEVAFFAPFFKLYLPEFKAA